MLHKTHITAIVGVATFIWAIVLWWRGAPVTFAELASFSTVVTGTFMACWLFDRYVWPCRVKKWCVFHGWLVSCPDIRGTWEVDLQSSWVDPATEKAVPPIKCYYGIRQSNSTLHMHLMTRESESWVTVHRFVSSDKTSGYRLTAVYTNQPNPFLRGARSEIHHGTIVLEFHGADSARPESFEGEYWTDRGTKGTMRGRRKSGRVATTYADAQAACA